MRLKEEGEGKGKEWGGGNTEKGVNWSLSWLLGPWKGKMLGWIKNAMLG